MEDLNLKKDDLEENKIENVIENQTENVIENQTKNVIESQDDRNYVSNESDQNSNTNNVNSSQIASFYSETYKKTSKKGHGILQLISVALIGSILGGVIVGGLLLFVAPTVQPSIKSFFGKEGVTRTSIFSNSNSSVADYKKVEIVQQTEDSLITTIAEKVSPSIVGIRSTFNVTSVFGSQQGEGEGSGIIISSDGYIMTNYHVISETINTSTKKSLNGAKIEVILQGQMDKSYVATVRGFDSKTDLAVLKIDATNLPVAELGNSDELKVGELAVAIGNPGGLEYMGSVTTGVISGLNRVVDMGDGSEVKFVQTDAAINPGNSGGALVNSKGQVIGVNSVKVSATGFEGLGFAIPINKVKEITDSLVADTYVKGRPYLGISVEQRYTEAVAKQNNLPVGIYVADVEMLGAAQKAGIKTGDIITKFAGTEVKTYAELETEKSKHKAGETVTIELYRISDTSKDKGETKTFTVILGEAK